MGFGIPQEIFKETYQRPLIINKDKQAETISWLRGRYPLGLFWFHVSEFAAVGGVGIVFLRNAKTHYPCPA
ncbi:MAG: hypothetical protein KKH97_05925 [Proteobacteria bacterium]|nr:hypothetical protein [Pseudomonadota bacterium]MBU1711485.1 hypothetical protein [Pseudomonadota bacterium]